jgi:putative endonuclease
VWRQDELFVHRRVMQRSLAGERPGAVRVFWTPPDRHRLRHDGRVTDRRRAAGSAAEAAAAEFLASAGLCVIERNVASALGELDLVCRDGETVVFVEVKCRQARWGDAPAAAVSWHKRRRLVSSPSSISRSTACSE